MGENKHRDRKDKKTAAVIESIRRVVADTETVFETWQDLADELNSKGITSARDKTWDGAKVNIFCGRQGLDLGIGNGGTGKRKRKSEPELPTRSDVFACGVDESAPDGENADMPVDVESTPEPTAESLIEPPSELMTHPIFEHTSKPEPESVLHDDTPPINPERATSLLLDPELLATLTEMAGWWRDRGADLMAMQNITWAQEPVDLSAQLFKPVFPGGSTHKMNSGVRLNKKLVADAMARAKSTRQEMYITGGTLSSLLEYCLWTYLDRDEIYLVQTESDSEGGSE